MLSIAILDYQNLSVSSPAGFLVEANGLLFMAIKSLGNMRYLKHHVIWVFSIFFRNKKTTNISGTYPYTTFHLSLSGNGWYIWSYDIYIILYPVWKMLEPHQHLGFWCLPQKLPGFPQELRWRARSEAPAGCTGEQLYLADAGPPGVVIYIYIHYYIYIIIYILYILLYILL